MTGRRRLVLSGAETGYSFAHECTATHRHRSRQPADRRYPDPRPVTCERLAGEPYVTIGTEFLRDKTYTTRSFTWYGWPAPKPPPSTRWPRASISPAFRAAEDPNVIRSSTRRGGCEIFNLLMGEVPHPSPILRVMAMACGFGDAAQLRDPGQQTGQCRLDKLSRFTDWAGGRGDRPATYLRALDVIHLRVSSTRNCTASWVSGRTAWLADEMAILHRSRDLRPRRTSPGSDGIATGLKELATGGGQSRTGAFGTDPWFEIAAHGPRDSLALPRGAS